MKSLRIDSCSFVSIVINGKTCTSDLIIYPDVHVITAPNQKVIELYNELISEKRVGACFHLAR